jgi:hypothetical protein
VLAAAGSDFSKIVKLNVYLKSYADFEAMNEVYITHFGDVKPVSAIFSCGACERARSDEFYHRRGRALRCWSYRLMRLWRWSVQRCAECGSISSRRIGGVIS